MIKKCQAPIFIIGNRRSGTTMLRLMVTSHPNLAIPPEGGFLIRLGWKYDRIQQFTEVQVDRFIEDLFQSPNIQDWEIQKSALRERFLAKIPCSYPELIAEIYLSYIDQKFQGEKNRWGDKTTWYLNYLPQIHTYYPEAQYIHIIRDGRAVAASFKRVSHLPDGIESITAEWLWSLNLIKSFGEQIGDGKYTEIRYEDLVRNPENELNNLCEFLREPYNDVMLNYWIKNRENELEPRRHLKWKSLTLEKVSTDRISKWKTELYKDEIITIELMSKEKLRENEYELTHQDRGPYIHLCLKIRKGIRFIYRWVKIRLRKWKHVLLDC